jgi:hypothetical protein
MSIGRTLGMAIACVLIASSTSVFAGDLNSAAQPVAAPSASTQPMAAAANAPAASANLQVASVEPAAVPAAQQKPGMDPLHADARWPLFKNCIDNTTTPAAFDACLQMAFLGAKPDNQVLALLTH